MSLSVTACSVAPASIAPCAVATEVAVAVALAMFASCSIATLVATALPAAFQRLAKDPAFGSGPLATVFQDLLSIAVYLAIAAAVVV